MRWLLGSLPLLTIGVDAQDVQRVHVEKQRVFVLTDIGPKPHPDDTQSLVRLLVYSNHFDIEGLVASTAAMRDRGVHPEYLLDGIDAYAKVRDNLLKHEAGFPTAERLRAVVKRGHDESGMDAVGVDRDSEGSEWLIRAVDSEDARPLWVLVWGGTNVLAQALWRVSHDRSEHELERFIDKLRVYAIGDQDNSGPWIRERFPSLFLIVSPRGYIEPFASLKAILTLGHYYTSSTFWAIGDELPGADNTVTSEEWLTDNIILGHGPLGAAYPEPRFVMEGDSPSFLYLVNNGLNVPEHPEYGGWGGRYEMRGSIYQDAEDTVIGEDGRTYTSNHATIWRWREAFQNDFAARMDWTVQSYEDANHPPELRLSHPARLNVSSNQRMQLDARQSTDPDGDELRARWIHYPEAGTFRGELDWGPETGLETQFLAPTVTRETSIHIILQVTDSGTPPLTRYRRVILNLQPNGE